MSELKIPPQQADITWTEDGAIKTTKCYRSLPEVLKAVTTLVPESVTGTVKVAVNLTVADNSTKEFVIIEDTRANVIAGIEQRTKSGTVENTLRMMAAKLMDLTSLKILIVTGVQADGKVSGFSLLTESSPVMPEDVVLAAEAAGHQVEAFRDIMRKSYDITFPDDKGRIIVPGR